MPITVRTGRDLWPAVLIAAIATVALCRTPFNASQLEVSPDAIEYALGAHALALDGHYAITVEGRELPPRYPPWFSAIVLAPSYVLLGREIGNAVVPILVFGVAGVVFAYLLGRRLGGVWGGSLAALAVLVLPEYRFWGRQIVTDVPTAALVIGLGWLYVTIRERSTTGPAAFVVPAAFIALAAAMRPLNAAAAIPFAALALRGGDRRERLGRLAVVIAPVGLVAAANAAYQAATFGSPLRTGYQFWCPVPYDYPELVFSVGYATGNLAALGFMGKWVVAAAAAATVVAVAWPRARRETGNLPTVRSVLAFVALGLGPIVLVHIIYFFPGDRFFLPLVAIAAATTAGVVGSWLRRWPAPTLAVVLLAVLAAAGGWRSRNPDPPPIRRLAAERIARLTPQDAWIVTAVEPPYLERLVARDSSRRIVPLSRSVEYASKLIARTRIPELVPPPRGWSDHRCEGLVRGGAEEAVRVVAAERPDLLGEALAAGHRVFVDTSLMSAADEPVLRRLEASFRVSRREDGLYELEAKPPAPF